MRRRSLLFAGALLLVLGCNDSTSPLPQPDPPPKPKPPATGMVAPVQTPDTAVAVHR